MKKGNTYLERKWNLSFGPASNPNVSFAGSRVGVGPVGIRVATALSLHGGSSLDEEGGLRG